MLGTHHVIWTRKPRCQISVFAAIVWLTKSIMANAHVLWPAPHLTLVSNGVAVLDYAP
jgi:hypothetical protein